MKINVHLLYLHVLFLDREVFLTTVVDKFETHLLHSVGFSPKIVPFMK